MKKRLLHTLKMFFEHKALVLMYHRVAVPDADIWDIAVSPENFEQQLQHLQKKGNVIPLSELVKGVANGKLRKNAVSITFDDGYADNFLTAKPLLEKYQLPATFFIASGNTDTEEEFWWDELEHTLLFAPVLPQTYANMPGEPAYTFDLQHETQLTPAIQHAHCHWDACAEAPPTLRARLFYELWQQLKPLPHQAQQRLLQHIRNWASWAYAARPHYKAMTAQQLRQLSQSSLFEIGAHTVTHAALAFHAKAVQVQELCENKQQLEAITGTEVPLLAYPYGNYNHETKAAAAEAGFTAAMTTEEKVIRKQSQRYALGRMQVKNRSGQDFAAQLGTWLHKR